MKNTKFHLSFLTLIALAQSSNAQTYQPSNRTPVADNTIGTQVVGGGNQFIITGGLNRGQTLFHSFTDFSIPTGGSANFVNPTGNRDIISRVTGNLFSDINGTLNSGGANFLLINPNGIVFGPNTQLNVGKAFAASTANGVDLLDPQGQRYTFGTNGAGDAPLLTINPNVFFNISRLNMGASTVGNPGIINYGTLQTNNDSQYIGLFGGNVTLNGGKIIAPGGRVDIGGLNSAGTITVDAQGLVFGGNSLTRGDVLFTNGASVSVRATQTLGTVNPIFNDTTALGSSINMSGNNINILNSGAKSANEAAAIDAGLEINSGVKTAAAGDININATGQLNLDNSDIKNTLREGAQGKIGDIKISANSLNLNNAAYISTSLGGKGNGGNIEIASGGVDLRNGSSILSENVGSPEGIGNAGNINIKTTGDISISGSTPQSTEPITADSPFSAISSNTYGQGNAGKITIDTQNQGKLSLSNNARIRSAISGKDAVGNGGDITILAKEVDLRNNSLIGSSNVGGKGDAGNINIKTTGDVSISGSTPQSTAPITADSNQSTISSQTDGQGNAGKITIDTQNQGKLFLSNNGNIFSSVAKDAVGNAGDITILAKEVDLRNDSRISSSNLGGKGDAGNINIKTTGDVSISGSTPQSTAPITADSNQSTILSTTYGQGNAGKITIDTQNQGKLFLSNNGNIFSSVAKDAVGNAGDITILAKEVDLRNFSDISSSNLGGKGDAGNINIKTTGDVSISGSTPQSTAPITADSKSSLIFSASFGQGNAGKITIDTQNQGKLLLSNKARIYSAVGEDAVGNGGDITILAKEVDLRNFSVISSSNVGGKGDAGNINIKTTGDVSISGSTPQSTAPITADSKQSTILSTTSGQGNAGKITIDTQNQGKLFLSNKGYIFGTVSKDAVGNGGDITILAKEVDLRNFSIISSSNLGGKGNAGNINIKTTGDVSISGSTPQSTAPITADSKLSGISSQTAGQGNAGKITIDTQNQGKLFLSNKGYIFGTVSKDAVGNGGDITILAKEVDLRNNSGIASSNFGGKGDAGNINIKTTSVTLKQGEISSEANNSTGGDITMSLSDFLFLGNNSNISTNSGSTDKNGNGGNITINTPFILTTPGNNDITANAYGGNGGRVNINSPGGLFGIGYRQQGSNLTNDITSTSTLGRSGIVEIKTPNTDPGKGNNKLPTVTKDISNQIDQVCGEQYRQNKLIVTGRGGLQPVADDPLTSDVVWQDPRAASSQPAPAAVTNQPLLPPPAIGWVFDGKGKVRLISATTPVQPTVTRVVCPNVVGK